MGDPRSKQILGKEDEGKLQSELSSMCSVLWRQIRVAFPFSPEEFVREAVSRGQPSSVFQGVTEALGKAIAANVQKSLGDLIKMRAGFFGHWTQRAKSLANDERKLRQSLPAHRREILEGKRLLLMKEMLTELGYRDVILVDDLMNGFKPCGSDTGSCSPAKHFSARIPQRGRLAP